MRDWEMDEGEGQRGENEGEEGRGRERDEPFEDDEIRSSTVQSLRVVDCRKEHVRELLLESLRNTFVVVEMSLKEDNEVNRRVRRTRRGRRKEREIETNNRRLDHSLMEEVDPER